MGALVAGATMGAQTRTLAAQTLTPPTTATRASNAPGERQFDIPAGPLSAALKLFEAVTGLRVQADSSLIEPFVSPGVQGAFTVERALTQLLEGTSLRFRFISPDTVAIDLQVTEFVSVEGAAARPAGTKFTEPLRDIPQTITVIPASVIEEQAATTLRDVLRNVVGITFQAGEGGVPAGDQLTIRGFSARTDIFVDGVRDFGGYSRDPFNLEQVEVAKGPSSAIAGRGSTGGAINMVSKAPQIDANYAVSLGGGNASYKRSTIDLNQPLEGAIPGTSLRLNAMWTDTGVPGRDAVESERWGVAPSMAMGLGTPTRLTVQYSHLAQDNLPEYGLPWVPANTNPELAEYSNSMPPVDQENFYGLRARDYENTVTDLGTVQVERDLPGAMTLRNLTRYGQTTRDSVITSPRFASVNTSTAINRQLQSRDMTDDILANQTNLTARFGSSMPHALVAGAEFAREGSENFARSGPVAPTADLYHPNPNDAYPGPITRTGARTTAQAYSAAVYAFDTVNVGERWELSGGLRWDRFDVDYESVAVAGERTPLERTDSMTSGRMGVVFKPRENGSIYAGFGTSFNPSAEGLSLTPATAAIEPEKTRALEVGTKWDVANRRLSLTAALFRTEKSNARTPGVNPGDPPTVLVGEQRVSGIELGAQGRINDRWTAFAAYSLMRSNIDESNTPAEVNNALALTPEQTFNLWTTFQLPWQIEVGGGAQYMDAVFRNATNTAVVPSYWLINGLAAYQVNRNLTLRLNLNNLADVDYVDRIGGGHYIPGAGRSVQLSSAVTF